MFSECKILVVGLPQTGKSTFLAALWDIVQSDEVPESLILEQLTGDQQHLNDLRDLWADCLEIPRTKATNERVVSMILRDRLTGKTSEVFFGDMDGESFERQWTERVWTAEYEAQVLGAGGIILFIHPAKVREAKLIIDAQPVIKRIASAKERTADSQPATVENAHNEKLDREHTIPAEPRFAATQVQLVELLQFITEARSRSSNIRLAVVISAWDVVTKTEKSAKPESWLLKRLPLLDQFLKANSDHMPYRVFGVSAQGGDIRKDAKTLRERHLASDRIIVVQGETTSHDLTSPVKWTMGVAEE